MSTEEAIKVNAKARAVGLKCAIISDPTDATTTSVKIHDGEGFIQEVLGEGAAALAYLRGFEEGRVSVDDAHWRTEQQEATLD
jgi:hypothetical protein